MTGDIKKASQIFGHGSMDVITTNPPYMIGGHGFANPESAKRSQGMKSFVHWMILSGKVRGL